MREVLGYAFRLSSISRNVQTSVKDWINRFIHPLTLVLYVIYEYLILKSWPNI